MIEIIRVSDATGGNSKAHDILKELVDNETLLALSGGTSVDYRKMIVEGADILPGCVCLVDERFGEPYHKDSNELILKNAGVFSYLDREGIEYQRILDDGDLEQTASQYNDLISELFERFEKRVGVMGVGANLHTAGIFPHSEAAASANYVVAETVVDKIPKRISLTLKALGEFQTFVILVFGEEKRHALRKLLDENENDMQKYPAIFYRKGFAKSYLITDQDL